MLPYFYFEDTCIDVESFEISISTLPDEFIGLKIALISDVHLPTSTSFINSLLDEVKKQNPDLIFLTGDVVDRRADLNTCGLAYFCQQLSKISPVYAVSGNNDRGTRKLELWTSILSENNVIVLDNTATTYTIGNSSIAILGLADNFNYSSSFYNSIENIESIPKLLLSHRPEKFANYFYSVNSIKPDLVFSGHAHGGQFRIPFINQGIYAPGQGLFPKYTSGLYTTSDNKTMIVSRGLCNSSFPIRINNRVHLPIITLTNE